MGKERESAFRWEVSPGHKVEENFATQGLRYRPVGFQVMNVDARGKLVLFKVRESEQLLAEPIGEEDRLWVQETHFLLF